MDLNLLLNEMTAFFLFCILPLLAVASAVVGGLWLVRRVTRQFVRGVIDELE